MSLYDYPADVTAHLKQLEADFNATGFDHSAPPLHGWRSERERACQIERPRANSNAPRRARPIFEYVTSLTTSLRRLIAEH